MRTVRGTARHAFALGATVTVAHTATVFAGVVSGVDLALLYARRLFTRIPSSGRAIRGLSVASAAIITILGLVLTLRALSGLV